jgi:filamentous hemagglutinin
VTVELQGVATGSGIGALAGQPGVVAGDVDLIAPKGTVNAGEAGIRATNLNIAAQFILNSQNIQVSGATTGAPVADSGGLTSGLAGNTVADQGQDATRALSSQSAEAQKTADDVRRALSAFNLISVEVLGFGEQ